MFSGFLGFLVVDLELVVVELGFPLLGGSRLEVLSHMGLEGLRLPVAEHDGLELGVDQQQLFEFDIERWQPWRRIR